MRRLTLLPACLALVALAACGSDSSSDAIETTTTTVPALSSGPLTIEALCARIGVPAEHLFPGEFAAGATPTVEGAAAEGSCSVATADGSATIHIGLSTSANAEGFIDATLPDGAATPFDVVKSCRFVGGPVGRLDLIGLCLRRDDADEFVAKGFIATDAEQGMVVAVEYTGTGTPVLPDDLALKTAFTLLLT